MSDTPSAADPPVEPPAALPAAGRPWATIALLAVLAGVYGVELATALGWSDGLLAPDPATLVGLGATMRGLVVDEGQAWRLLTAAFLHGDVFHLAFNGVALFMAGVVVEPLLGAGWLLALFAAGAVAGSSVSVLVHDDGIVGVGASGAIMALLACAVIVVRRLPAGVERTNLQVQLARVLIPSLLPISRATQGVVDYAAHFGGAAFGAVAGLALLRAWPRDRAAAPGRRVVAVVPVVAAVVLGYAGTRLAEGWGDIATVSHALGGQAVDEVLIPDERFPDFDDPAAAAAFYEGAPALVATYPRDPRAHLFAGIRAMQTGDAAAAEQAFREGLAQQDVLAAFFGDGHIQRALRMDLALAVATQGRRDEARTVAGDMCDGPYAPKELAEICGR